MIKAVVISLVFVALGLPAFAQDVPDPAAMGLIDTVVNLIASQLGLEIGSLAVVLLILRQVCEIAHKSIPDTATGWIHWVDKTCQYIAMYKPSTKAKKTEV